VSHVIVVGAGIGGLGTALALSRTGHQVTLLERDHTPMPATADAAFDWDRTGAPQVRHSHVFLARLRILLLERFPDVLTALHDAGVEDRHMLSDLPDTLDDTSAQPGDDELVILAGRRTTFEWVLRRVVLDEPGVVLRDGVSVSRLVAPDGVVIGVETTDGETLLADAVVAANGRRADLPAWASPLGVTIDETVEESGITYLSRFYRRRPGTVRPAGAGFGTADLGYVKAGLFPCDHDTISVTLATAVDDRELRRLLSDPDTFDRGCRELPSLAPWLLEDEVDAISDVHFMSGLINRTRTFLDDGGGPLLPGFFAVGDAHTCTNPIYGRGCSLALVMATELADAIAAHPEDPSAQSVRYEAAVAREIAPWHRASVAQDTMAKAAGSEMRRGGSLGSVLGTAMRTDATVLRAFLRMLNLLSPPESLMGDPDLLARFAAAGEREPVVMDMGPTSRDDFVALLGT
jgi:2-polyprenyl-6-methoxyphenol hydroxylase-like FAD-dependent oxidoreductase